MQHSQFVVEGRKAIEDFLREDYQPVALLTTRESEQERNSFRNGPTTSTSYEVVSSADMRQMTGLSTACDALAVFRKRNVFPEKYDNNSSSPLSEHKFLGHQSAMLHSPGSTFAREDLNIDINLALDAVRDPGNLGTLIRMSDWFGLRHVLCSSDCCDCYNPKVVRATSGSLARVNVHYFDSLSDKLTELGVPVLGASMQGSNIYQPDAFPKNQQAVLVMGSEGQGLSREIEDMVESFVSIPAYAATKEGGAAHPMDAHTETYEGNLRAESLNVAMAAGILVSEIKRASGQ